MLELEYNSEEAVGGDRYLTPVYFNPQVLIRYMYDSRFHCDFTSDTYGSLGNHEFDLPFGINPNGAVILWLGDLTETAPKREQLHWLVENKAPEGNPTSQFYDAQINSIFTEPPIAVQFLNALARLNAEFHERFRVYLYHAASLEVRIAEVRRYSRLVINNIDDFKRFLSELNEIVNENTNNVDLRAFLISMGIALPSGIKGNKLLERVYEVALSDIDNLVAPFFCLYDLRLWAGHGDLDQKRDEAAAKLGVTDPLDHHALMRALLNALTESCRRLLEKVDA